MESENVEPIEHIEETVEKKCVGCITLSDENKAFLIETLVNITVQVAHPQAQAIVKNVSEILGKLR
jgi:hypothetical protein